VKTWACMLPRLYLIMLGVMVLAPLYAWVYGAELRWSVTSNTIYVTGAGHTTLTGIKEALDQAPLEQLPNGRWHLRAHLVIEDGAQLDLHGTRVGGDVDLLLLQSNNSSHSNQFVTITADWGTISIRNTSITSWDDAEAGPDREYATYGRAHIGVRSRLSDDGLTALESRMDISDSDIGYLGFDEAEAYGLSWKVLGDQPGLYDRVNVLGDILSSHIHHNYFGIYTFGAFGMQWLGNEVDNNIQYGFDPHDDSDHLLIQNNRAHHNGNHGFIASMRCDHLTIRSNSCWANGQNGIMLHRGSDDCLIEDNQCFDNLDTGIVIAGSSRNTVRRNHLARNFEAGLRLNLGAADNWIEANHCVSNTWHGFFLFKGDDPPEPGDDGRPKRNQFFNNRIDYQGKEAIQLADSDDNTFATNQFFANGDKLRFERGSRNRLDGNEVPADVTLRTEGTPASMGSTYVTRQASLIVQLDTNSVVVYEDSRGQIFDPEETRVASSVTPDGSRLVLTSAEIGTTSKVQAHPFWVRPNRGTVWINPTGWTNHYGSGKQWTVQPEEPGLDVAFTLAGLAPRSAYSLRNADTLITNLTSDPNGRISFSNAFAGTNKVRFALEPSLQLYIQRGVSNVVVSWTGGWLQSCMTNDLSTWHTLSLPVGPFATNIQSSRSFEMFRVISNP
jgi:parallel beta-helix repeat protein